MTRRGRRSVAQSRAAAGTAGDPSLTQSNDGRPGSAIHEAVDRRTAVPRPYTSPEPAEPRSRLETLSQLSALAGVAAAALFSALYYCYSRFYNPLGLSPSDLGLDFQRVLAQSASMVFTAVLFALPGVLVSRAPFVRRIVPKVPAWALLCVLSLCYMLQVLVVLLSVPRC